MKESRDPLHRDSESDHQVAVLPGKVLVHVLKSASEPSIWFFFRSYHHAAGHWSVGHYLVIIYFMQHAVSLCSTSSI